MGILGWYQIWETRNKYLNLVLGLVLLAPLNLLAAALIFVYPGSKSWYCNTVFLAKATKDEAPH
jgi:hypothetical protein